MPYIYQLSKYYWISSFHNFVQNFNMKHLLDSMKNGRWDVPKIVIALDWFELRLEIFTICQNTSNLSFCRRTARPDTLPDSNLQFKRPTKSTTAPFPI